MARVPMDDPFPASDPRQHGRLLREVRDRIRSMDELPHEVREELAKHADEFLEIRLEHSNNKFYGGQLGWHNWVIRNEHLDLLAILGPTAVAIAAAVSTASGGTLVVPSVTALLAIAALSRKIGSKVTQLRHEDYAVLMALKQMGPSTASDVAGVLSAKPPRAVTKLEWNESFVLETLEHLHHVPARDGTIEALTNRLDNGLWTANGV